MAEYGSGVEMKIIKDGIKGLDHCEILKKIFFYWLKKSFEPFKPFKIRETVSYLYEVVLIEI